MVALRVVIQWLLHLILGMAGMVAFFAGMAMLGASLLSLAMGRLSQGPSQWLTEVFVGAGIMGAVFLGGGLVIAAVKAASASKGTVLEEDRTLSEAWVLPALVPTLLLPTVTVVLSWKLVILWRDIFTSLERMGVRFELSRANDWAGWILLPIVGVLFVPFLEALTASLLVVLPPLLLLALIVRAPAFRTNAQQIVVLQAMFVTASLVGSQLFSRLSLRLVPEIQRIGGPETPVVLEALGRGRDVLGATAWAHAAVLAVYGVCLWVFMAAQDSRRVGSAWTAPVATPEPELPAPAAVPALIEADPPPAFEPLPAEPTSSMARTSEQVSALPQDARQAFEEALARFRARHGQAQTAPMPVHARGESTATGALPTGGALTVDMASWRKTARTALQTILLGLGALMLTFGALQLLTPRPRFSEASPAPGGSLPRPPAAIEVRFSQALNPAATISLHRSMGPGGDYAAAGPVVEHTRALSRDDVSGRSLRLDPLPPLTGGVYRVDWRVMAAGRTDITYGHYFFAVGASMPEEMKGPQGRPFAERDARHRGNRAALLSGVILLVLALLVPGRVLRD